MIQMFYANIIILDLLLLLLYVALYSTLLKENSMVNHMMQLANLHICTAGLYWLRHGATVLYLIYSIAGTAFTKHTILLGVISCLFSLASTAGL